MYFYIHFSMATTSYNISLLNFEFNSVDFVAHPAYLLPQRQGHRGSAGSSFPLILSF